jgi:hypothetical protein
MIGGIANGTVTNPYGVAPNAARDCLYVIKARLLIAKQKLRDESL